MPKKKAEALFHSEVPLYSSSEPEHFEINPATHRITCVGKQVVVDLRRNILLATVSTHLKGSGNDGTGGWSGQEWKRFAQR